jgi:excisionase family DNA binding protein
MENPFEIISHRLDRIETLLNNLYSNGGKNIIKHDFPELMDIKKLSDYLGVSNSYIYKMTSTKNIPHSKRGKKLFFEKEKVTNWALENEIWTQDEIHRKANEYLIKNRMKKF